MKGKITLTALFALLLVGLAVAPFISLRARNAEAQNNTPTQPAQGPRVGVYRNQCSGKINLGAGGLGNSDTTFDGANADCLKNYHAVQCYSIYPAATATPAAGQGSIYCFAGATATQFATQSAPTATQTAVFAVAATLGGPTPTVVWQGIN